MAVENSMLTRREALKQGAFLGTLVWMRPSISSMRLTQAQAEETSPPVEGGSISYIGMNIVCTDGTVTTAYVIKYEGCAGDDCFEPDPGNFPKCTTFDPDGEKADGDELGFLVQGPNAAGCVKVTVPAGCEVLESAVKSGQCCQPGPTGTGTLTFCPPIC